jgi:hypothetical protein
MKQLLVLALTAMMVLALSTVSLAGTVSLDYLVGTWESPGYEGDLTGFVLSLDAPFDPWKLGIEYFANTWEDTPVGSYDATWTGLDFGYLVSSSDSLNFYLNLGYVTSDDDAYNIFTAWLLSADLNFLISDTSSFDVSLSYSISGEAYGGNDATITIAVLKYSYFFNESVGLGIGYRYYSFDEDGAPSAVLNSGFTLGVSFKF